MSTHRVVDPKGIDPLLGAHKHTRECVLFCEYSKSSNSSSQLQLSEFEVWRGALRAGGQTGIQQPWGTNFKAKSFLEFLIEVFR